MRPATIGALAKATGVKVPTIRYYEEIGLMPEAERSAANRRLYGAAAFARLGFIRHARELGFDIEEIRGLIALSGDPEQPCAELDRIARDHLARIDSRLARLTRLRGEVARMVDACSHGRVGECRVLEVLSDHGECASEIH
ncbi:MAG: helix-turn-helix domain-containing protein [Alphaproteobacteria bacterium]|nr:helix-turn-helix domain-containing protein [Alphaproteobacteria bacterium]